LLKLAYSVRSERIQRKAKLRLLGELDARGLAFAQLTAESWKKLRQTLMTLKGMKSFARELCYAVTTRRAALRSVLGAKATRGTKSDQW
jgi:hypothetical protein